MCKGGASLYCESDSAFLCWNCDARVHEANFLVARHVRRTVCFKCKGFDGNRISGVGFEPFRSICGSCLPESGDDDLDSLSSSSSSICISSAESYIAAPKKIHFDRQRPKTIASSCSVTEVSSDDSCFLAKFSGEDDPSKKRKDIVRTLRSGAPTNVDLKAEGILVNWCRKLGLMNSGSVPLASHAFGLCLQKLTVLPFRVALASSLWISWRYCEGRSASTCRNLKRLAEISGVPARLILLTASKLSRSLKMKKKSEPDQEEGWAECSD